MKDKIEKNLYFIRHFGIKIRDDHVASFAAHAALFMVMSIFPLTMFLFTFIRRLPLELDILIQYIDRYMPEVIQPLSRTILSEVYKESAGSFTLLTLFITLYCASKGFYAIRLGLNAVYGIRETRHYFWNYCIAILYVIVFVIMIILTFVLVVFGERIVDAFLLLLPQYFRFEILIHIARYAVAFTILTVFFLLLYLNVPNRKSKVQYEIFGACFTTIGWTVYSYAFSFYIAHLANYSITYGSLATMIVFLMWFYFSMYILFLGAELNVMMSGSKYQKK